MILPLDCATTTGTAVARAELEAAILASIRAKVGNATADAVLQVSFTCGSVIATLQVATTGNRQAVTQLQDAIATGAITVPTPNGGTAAASTYTAPSVSKKSKGLNAGAIAGGIIGGLALVLIIAAVAILLHSRRQSSARIGATPSSAFRTLCSFVLPFSNYFLNYLF
jgi:hypothetical protein